jgi:hypothetical protein
MENLSYLLFHSYSYICAVNLQSQCINPRNRKSWLLHTYVCSVTVDILSIQWHCSLHIPSFKGKQQAYEITMLCVCVCAHARTPPLPPPPILSFKSVYFYETSCEHYAIRSHLTIPSNFVQSGIRTCWTQNLTMWEHKSHLLYSPEMIWLLQSTVFRTKITTFFFGFWFDGNSSEALDLEVWNMAQTQITNTPTHYIQNIAWKSTITIWQ